MYYYGMMVKNAPYKFAEFESLTFKYGTGDTLLNQYYSKTGDFQFVNAQDSVMKTKVKLSKDDLLYLHRKAADLGFWNFPEDMESGLKGQQARYYLEFKYQRKTKHIKFDVNYNGKPQLKDAVRRLIEEVNGRIEEAQKRGR